MTSYLLLWSHPPASRAKAPTFTWGETGQTPGLHVLGREFLERPQKGTAS